VVASSTYRATQPITVVCPRCLLPLPAVQVTTESEIRDRRTVRVQVQPVELDAEWWRLARRGHPNCLPDDDRKVRRLPGAGFEVIDG
jgi:hypothetical protein